MCLITWFNKIKKHAQVLLIPLFISLSSVLWGFSQTETPHPNIENTDGTGGVTGYQQAEEEAHEAVIEETPPPLVPWPLPDVKPIDALLYTQYPYELGTLAVNHLPQDNHGLLGRNAEWGQLHQPIFQLGAGYSLRMAIVAGAQPQAQLAFAALFAGSQSVDDQGALTVSLPDNLQEMYADKALSEVATLRAAVLFLGDACMGMLALESSPYAHLIATPEDRQRVLDKFSQATSWLIVHNQALTDISRAEPYLLFASALAYHACGVLSGNDDATYLTGEWLVMAHVLFEPAGFFIEQRGWDTHYQARILSIIYDLLVSGVAAEHQPVLRAMLRDGAMWLSFRIDDEGRIDSSGNTRSCAGGEEILGKDTVVSAEQVFRALVSAGTLEQTSTLLDAAERISAWQRANPDADPC